MKNKNYVDKIKITTQTIFEGHNKMSYRGIPLRKCPFDYIIYQMIISELQPDLIIEIGSDQGGSALYMADILEFNNKGIVHAIDIKNNENKFVNENKRIKWFSKGWENYEVDKTKYNNILIIEDSTHYSHDTLAILKKFNEYVTINSYFIIEDGIVDELKMSKAFYGGPLKAIKEFIKLNDDFIVDRKWCDFFGVNATFNVNGYLKKIR